MFQKIETGCSIDEPTVGSEAPEMIGKSAHVQCSEDGTLPRQLRIDWLKHHKAGANEGFARPNAALDAAHSGTQFATRIDENFFDAQENHVRINYLERCNHVMAQRDKFIDGLPIKIFAGNFFFSKSAKRSDRNATGTASLTLNLFWPCTFH
jgi:hypothetical protein